MDAVRFVSPLPRDKSLLQPQSLEDWMVTLRQIKKLYLRCHYKQCVSSCEKLLQDTAAQIHPVYRAYLLFFVAICYESLGLAVHSLSSKKLPYLEKSKKAFVSVSEALSQALCFQAHPDIYDSSLELSDSTSLTAVQHTSDPFVTPAKPNSNTSHDRVVAALINHYEDLDKDLFDLTLSLVSPLPSYSRDQDSHNTVLDKNELMPKPLTIKKKVPVISQNTPPPRPLPPIPIKQNSLLTQRKPAIPPAINTNIVIPTPPQQRLQTSRLKVTAVDATKQTRNDCSDPLPLPRRLDPFTVLLLTRSLTRYTHLLTSLQGQISSHTAALTVLIDTATAHLASHLAQKSASKPTRLASFWCLRDDGPLLSPLTPHPSSSHSPLTPISPNIAVSRTPVPRRRHRQAAAAATAADKTPPDPRSQRPAPHATLPSPSPHHPLRTRRSLVRTTGGFSGAGTATHNTCGGDTEDQRARRIERLRARGWTVRKEDKGWKGGEHYEMLRARASEDLLVHGGAGGGGRFLF